MKTRLFKYIENFATKKWKFSDKNSDIFLIFAQNINFGYSLEPPRRGGSNEYPQYMFLSRSEKDNVYPFKPQFYYTKVGFKGVSIIKTLLRDAFRHLCSTKIQISLRIHAIWSESSLGTFWIANDAKFLHADNKEFDQTALMLRLTRVFAGRIFIHITFSHVAAQMYTYTVELRWLEPLWDHENLFETAVVRATEGYY